jgi:hypothetical protein
MAENIMLTVGGNVLPLQTALGRGAESVKGFEKSSAASLKKLSGSFKLAGAVAAGAFALVAKKVISATIEQEKAIAALESALKATGNQTGYTSKQLQDMASAFQSVTTYGDESIIQMQALLATFKAIGGDNFKRAQENILNLATAMGMDLTSATRMVGRALNDPVQGMTALSRVGIILSDDQKKLIKTMTDTGRTAEAQGIILKELEGRFAGAAAAARNTLGGAIEGLKNAFGDLFEGDGGELARSVNKMTEILGSPETQQAAASMVATILWISQTAVDAAVYIDKMTRSVAEFFGRAASSGRALDSLEDYKYQISDLSKQRAKIDAQLRSGRGISPERKAEMEEERKFILFQITELQRMRALVKETGDPFGAKPVTPDRVSAPDVQQIDLADLLVPTGTTEEITDRIAEAREAFDAAVASMREGFIGSVPGIDSPEDYEAGRALLQEHYDAVAEMNAAFQEQLNIDSKTAANQRIMDAIAEEQGKLNARKQFFSDAVGLAQSSNSKLAKIGKAFAVVRAVQEGYQSALSAWKWGMTEGGPPLAAAYTAMSVAKTASLLSAIKGGGSTVSTAAGTAAVQTQESASRVVSISFQGGDYERGLGERLIDTLNNEIARGGKISGVQMA